MENLVFLTAVLIAVKPENVYERMCLVTFTTAFSLISLVTRVSSNCFLPESTTSFIREGEVKIDLTDF